MVTVPDIPGHKVGGVIGTGGFATVYRTWQIAVGREVAVKVDNRVLTSERDQRRFVREVTAAGRLSGHPHVIDVYDAGMLRDGRPFLVMELCPAGSLNDTLRRNGPMSPARVRDIGIRIADALAAAHAAGVLHRDIKPANILVNRYGVVGLSDFGLASIMVVTGEQSATREALTPAYASPESFRAEEPTVAGDIYSLAATLYGLLAGRPPRFPAGGQPGLATIIAMHDRPVDDVPGVAPEFMAILRSGLASDPAARLRSAAALRDALIAAPAGPGYSRGARHSADRSAPEGPPTVGPPAAVGDAFAGSFPARTGDDTSTGSTGPAARGSASVRTRDTAPVHRRPSAARLVALAAALVVVAAGAAFLGARFLGHSPPAGASLRNGSGHRGAPAVFGVPTVVSGCPAASVRSAEARCPRDPECWNGLVIISGDVTAGSLPCAGPHEWETFAIAILPTAVQTYDENIVQADASVRAVCSMPVLLKSRVGPARRIPRRNWTIVVMPPDQVAFDSGARAYRCVAHKINGAKPRTAQFRP